MILLYMVELRVKIPKELESEFESLQDIEVSILVSKLLKDKLSKIVRFKQAVSKSKLTQSQADELTDDISKSLSKRYDRL